MKKIFLSIILFTILIASITTAATLELNGTIAKNDGTALNSTIVNVTIKNGPTQIAINSTTTNSSGWFNMTIANVETSYSFIITPYHPNETTGIVDYVGQSMFALPYAEINAIGSGINYYLEEAATINISVMNGSAAYTPFSANVFDKTTGNPVQTCWSNVIPGDDDYLCYVPRNRNYSIQVYSGSSPETNFVPVSFDWDNFSTTTSYDIPDNNNAQLSSYNATSYVLHKTFNVTEYNARVVGYLNSSELGIFGWDAITIVPYLLNPGNMIFADYGTLPYNVSSWWTQEDRYNLTAVPTLGEYWNYNITVPYAPAETVNFVLFASARNSSTYYGSYRNLTANAAYHSVNFTMYGLLGSNRRNISMTDSTDPAFPVYNVTTMQQEFNIVNATNNATIQNAQFHIESKLDYTSYGMGHEFTFMKDLSSGNSTIYLSLLNITGFKEMNVYSMGGWAPKNEDTRTAAEIALNQNISMTAFNPESLGGDTGSSISIALYKSNSSCDVPVPGAGCLLTTGDMGAFSMFKYVIGGGALSFRMGMSSVLVHFVNVDMMASGPPAALFENDDDVTEGVSSGFDKLMKFGSLGPNIYDYIIVSMPYTEGSSTVAGLNETSVINISVPYMYDEHWNLIWNATANGTVGTALSGNYSHYTGYESEWQTLMGSTNCSTNQNATFFNATNPCYLDTSNNRIWIRLPHFSGTQSRVNGDVTVVVAAEEESSSSSSTSGGSSSSDSATYDAGELDDDGYTKTLSSGDSVSFEVAGEAYSVELTSISATSIELELIELGITTTINEGSKKRIDLDGDGLYDVYITCDSAATTTAQITIELYTGVQDGVDDGTTDDTDADAATLGTEGELGDDADSKPWYKKAWIWILIGVAIVLIVLIVLRFTVWKK